MNSRPTQLVRHVYPGYTQLYELQVYSQVREKWFMLHTSHRYDDIEKFCVQHGYTVPDKTIDCIHERSY